MVVHERSRGKGSAHPRPAPGFAERLKTLDPLLASTDGLSLVAYTRQPNEPPMTVGGELNNGYTESLPFGEAIAIRMLQEMSLIMSFNEEDASFQLTRFDGVAIRIFGGKVVALVLKIGLTRR